MTAYHLQEPDSIRVGQYLSLHRFVSLVEPALLGIEGVAEKVLHECEQKFDGVTMCGGVVCLVMVTQGEESCDTNIDKL